MYNLFFFFSSQGKRLTSFACDGFRSLFSFDAHPCDKSGRLYTYDIHGTRTDGLDRSTHELTRHDAARLRAHAQVVPSALRASVPSRSSSARLGGRDGARVHRRGRIPHTHRTASRGRCVEVRALRNFDYPEAILFDCDGVLCETERDGHRVTFNMTFKEKGLDHEWWGLARARPTPGINDIIHDCV